MHPVADLLVCLRFFTRLPVPLTPREAELGAYGFGAAASLVPIAGAIVGLVPASVLLAASLGDVPPLPSAALAIAALVLVTGALHEDGLADCADGFGGGRTSDRKLEIMRDSRIGAFGACAIALSLSIRVTALGAVTARPWLGALAVIVAASLSRTLCLLPLGLLPPARKDGLGVDAGRPSPIAFTVAGGLAIGLCLGCLAAYASPGRIVAIIGLPLAGAALASMTAHRQIGGQTGDVIGATQQVAEAIALVVLAGAP